MLASKCCFCFDLRRGVQVLAIVDGIFALLRLSGCISLISVGFDMTERQEVLGKTAYITETVLSILLLMACISLHMGATERKLTYLIPWMVLALISVIARTAFVIYFGVDWFAESHMLMSLGIVVCVILGVAIIVTLYFWFIVYSLFMTFRAEKKASSVLKQPEEGPRQQQDATVTIIRR